jgi:hypothetical protein
MASVGRARWREGVSGGGGCRDGRRRQQQARTAAAVRLGQDGGGSLAAPVWGRRPVRLCLGKEKGSGGIFAKKKNNSHGGLPEVKMLK